MKRALSLFAVVAAACGTHPSEAPHKDAAQFVIESERELKLAMAESDRADWVQSTYITDDTEWLAARRTENVMELRTRLIDEARQYEREELSPELQRKLYLLKTSPTVPAPKEAALRRELADLGAELQSMYGKGRACLSGTEECYDLQGLSDIINKSRDYDRLTKAWAAWHSISVPMRKKYERYVELSNLGAKEMGFADTGDLWRSRYDMTPAEFEAEVQRLWGQVKPFYDSLHCYVRKKLSDKYGKDKVPANGPIPAQLLGNMWAQEWSNLYDMLTPYPEQPSLEVTKTLVAQKYDAVKMMKTGEGFFTSLGMPPLPETFWKRSMLVQPRDRDAVCHASAWDIGMSGDVRIKMCTNVNEDDLNTIHHELGHIYYYVNYGELTPLFREGANDGFHEGIGDTLVLSMTPKYFQKLGLLTNIAENPKSDLNVLMKRALDKVAFLPFGLLVDQWRWQVFDGRVTPANYNAGWWALRTKYQGIAPPVARTEADFDPGAKYHVPSVTPYTRYFLAHILQFQFHRALCRAAGFEGQLHQCSIYGSKPAGEKLRSLLALGASKPWQEALLAVSGEKQMDASAIAEYFAPLKTWLDEQNAGQTCGW
jgi:peptidyl-dipeptidase A